MFVYFEFNDTHLLKNVLKSSFEEYEGCMVEYIIISSYERVIFPHINNVETNLSFWLQEDIDAQISEVFIGRIKINFYVTYSCI